MGCKEFKIPPPELGGLEINSELFQGKLRACTRSIYCAGASAEAIHHIAHKAKKSIAEVTAQALPLQKPKEVSIMNLGNYNQEGTGDAYRALIHDDTLEITAGHADTVKPF